MSRPFLKAVPVDRKRDRLAKSLVSEQAEFPRRYKRPPTLRIDAGVLVKDDPVAVVGYPDVLYVDRRTLHSLTSA